MPGQFVYGMPADPFRKVSEAITQTDNSYELHSESSNGVKNGCGFRSI